MILVFLNCVFIFIKSYFLIINKLCCQLCFFFVCFNTGSTLGIWVYICTQEGTSLIIIIWILLIFFFF